MKHALLFSAILIGFGCSSWNDAPGMDDSRRDAAAGLARDVPECSFEATGDGAKTMSITCANQRAEDNDAFCNAVFTASLRLLGFERISFRGSDGERQLQMSDCSSRMGPETASN